MYRDYEDAFIYNNYVSPIPSEGSNTYLDTAISLIREAAHNGEEDTRIAMYRLSCEPAYLRRGYITSLEGPAFLEIAAENNNTNTQLLRGCRDLMSGSRDSIELAWNSFWCAALSSSTTTPPLTRTTVAAHSNETPSCWSTLLQCCSGIARALTSTHR